jgi:hypothetical protein
MKGKIVIWLAATLILIGWDYYKNRNAGKTLTAISTFLWIASVATVGITMRPILPLFATHYILVLTAWAGLIFYIWRDKYYWWIFALPAVTILVFIGLNFLEGSRYER